MHIRTVDYVHPTADRISPPKAPLDANFPMFPELGEDFPDILAGMTVASSREKITHETVVSQHFTEDELK